MGRGIHAWYCAGRTEYGQLYCEFRDTVFPVQLHLRKQWSGKA